MPHLAHRVHHDVASVKHWRGAIRARIAGVLLLMVPMVTACTTTDGPATPAMSAAAATAPTCPPHRQAAMQELIYFGRDMPGGRVDDADWARFLAEAVTPRFPAGLSHWPASGQWRSDTGSIVQEPSWVLSLVHPGDEASQLAVEALTRSYRERFAQEAVLRVSTAVCMSL